jgi:hypothetical protein
LVGWASWDTRYVVAEGGREGGRGEGGGGGGWRVQKMLSKFKAGRGDPLGALGGRGGWGGGGRGGRRR